MPIQQDVYGVWVASTGVPYADGAEEQVLTELLAAVDRSAGSDELAQRIHDWPSRYHFSPLRANLLRPLRIPPGARILDVGCGSGTLTRWLGEAGNQVVGVEGNLERARGAAVRCQDLPQVQIVAGRIDDLPAEPLFDIAAVVGVLEYSPAFIDPVDGPNRLLAAVRERVTADGALVLAIENPLGLKYLLGYAEDHRGLPWVGVEGYRKPGPRTWSRKQLSAMLSTAGFPAQRWMYPFPDYKLPTAVIDDRLYRRHDGVTLIDAFLRRPVSSDAGQPSLLCDARSAHRQLLEAGLGPDVANSFLVVASAREEGCARVVGSELGWLFGDQRQRRWRRARAVVARDNELFIEDRSDGSIVRGVSWLSQAVRPGRIRPVALGQALDLLLLDAVRRCDLDRAADLLKAWGRHLEGYELSAPSGSVDHPFGRLDDDDTVLPGGYLDIGPGNFVLGDDGDLAYIDDEWVASGPVSSRLVRVRALWWFAWEIVASGEAHAWGPGATVDEVCQSLCRLAAISCPSALLETLRWSEAALQHLVHGRDQTVIESELGQIGSRRTLDMSPRVLPVTALRTSLDAERDRGATLESRNAELESQAVALIAARDALRADLESRLSALADVERLLQLSEERVNQLTTERDGIDEQRLVAEARVADLRGEVLRLREELGRWRDRFAAIEQRLPLRLYRRLCRPRQR